MTASECIKLLTMQVVSEEQAQGMQRSAELSQAQHTIEQLTATKDRAQEAHNQELEQLRADLRAKEQALDQERSESSATSGALAQLRLQSEAEAAQHLQQVARLQQQLREAEASRAALEAASSRTLEPSVARNVQEAADSVLSGLGLDSWRDDRLGARAKRASDAGGLTRMEEGLKSSKARPLPPGKGHVSTRMWLVIAYAAALHVFVMLQFTRHNATQCGSLGAGAVGAPMHLRAHTQSA